MKAANETDKAARLRADISIATMVTRPGLEIRVLGALKPVLSRGVRLPAAATHRFPNATVKSSTIKLSFFFGDNQIETRDVSLGQFFVKGFPHSPVGPSEIELRISVDAEEVLCCSVRDPSTEGQRTVGFIDLGKIKPPPTLAPSRPWAWVQDMANPAKILGELFDPSRRPLPRPGEDLTQSLSISFGEGLHGAQKGIEALGDLTCPTCAGSGTQPGHQQEDCPDCQGCGWVRTEDHTELGRLVSQSTCRTCSGSGKVITKPCETCQGETVVSGRRPFVVTVPPGIDTGTRICYPLEGEPGRHGGRPGHLYVDVVVSRDPLFTRLGRSVSIRLPVSADFAKAGGQLRIPDVEEGGFFLLALPPDARDGAKFRVYGDESYTLDAVIQIYHPYNPLALLKHRRRLRAIKAALQQREYQAQA